MPTLTISGYGRGLISSRRLGDCTGSCTGTGPCSPTAVAIKFSAWHQLVRSVRKAWPSNPIWTALVTFLLRNGRCRFRRLSEPTSLCVWTSAPPIRLPGNTFRLPWNALCAGPNVAGRRKRGKIKLCLPLFKEACPQNSGTLVWKDSRKWIFLATLLAV